MRRRARTDQNQAEIVKALRGIGCTVYSMAQLGDGMPDLLVGYKGKTWLVEVKDGNKPPSARKKTEDQIRFWDTWTGGGLVMVESAEHALKVIR